MKNPLFHLQISQIRKAKLLSEIVENAKIRRPSYLCAVNAHMTAISIKDNILKQAVNAATWAVTDGMPVVWAFNRFNKSNQERIAGMDLMPRLLFEANKESFIISVYGNTEENLKLFKAYVIENYPKVRIGTFISPPFRTLTHNETFNHINNINNSGTNILFVSLGCPKQEKWMLENGKKVNAVSLGIGNAVNTTIGLEKRPPSWLRNIGMEWFYRLIQNPKRLFRRYIITNTMFIWLLLKQLVAKKN